MKTSSFVKQPLEEIVWAVQWHIPATGEIKRNVISLNKAEEKIVDVHTLMVSL